MRTIHRLMTRQIGHRREVLIEFGVGNQDHFDLYRRFAKRAIVSDIYRDPEIADLCREALWTQYCIINVDSLPIRPSCVDVAFTHHVLDHFPNRKRNLAELRRIMRPDGIVCHVVPLATCFVLGHIVNTVASVLALNPRLGSGIHGEYDSAWQEIARTTFPAWRRLFEDSGFEILDDGPGTLGLRPLRPAATLWMSDRLGVYGSWVFVMRVSKHRRENR